ncbi:MAG: MarR family transcriptional regulator [Waddliaceae bacterium]
MTDNFNFNKVSVHEGPDRSPGFLLWHISTSWRSSIEQVLKSFDLTHPQFVILAVLGWLTREGDRVTQAMIGKMASLDPNTTSQVVRGLEKKGFLKREPSSDGRAKNPILTDKGKGVLAKALPAVEAADHQFFNPLTEFEMETFLKIFQKLAKSE